LRRLKLFKRRSVESRCHLHSEIEIMIGWISNIRGVLRGITHSCEDKKKRWRVTIRHWSYSLGFQSLCQKTLNRPPQKNEPFSQEIHLKIPLWSRALKLTNSKPICTVSALHFFVK
jgi:hypothetical protein